MAEIRSLNPSERALIDRLLSVEFPGRLEIEEQIRLARVETVDEDGSIRFYNVGGPPAAVAHRIPVEAEGVDLDGISVHALLHVIEGKVHELELFKSDGSRVTRWPDTGALNLFAPPAPKARSDV